MRVLRERSSELNIAYVSLAKEYLCLDNALNDMVSQLNSYIEKQLSIGGFILDKIRDIIRHTSIEAGSISIDIGLEKTSPIMKFSEVVSRLAKIICSHGAGAIVFDELQNLLRHTEWSPWSLIKFFIDLQEYTCSGGLRFVFITSDYLFRERIVLDTPIEYILTYYLGEMCYSDAKTLLKRLVASSGSNIEIESIIDDILGVIGGSPSKTMLLVDLIGKIGLRKAIEYMVSTTIEDLYDKLYYLLDKYSLELKVFTDAFVDKIVVEPMETTSLYRDKSLRASIINRLYLVIRELIRHNILQYSPREYTGIYKWNREKSGGLAPLTMVAPSSRLHLYAFCELSTIESSVCRDLKSIARRLIT